MSWRYGRVSGLPGSGTSSAFRHRSLGPSKQLSTYTARAVSPRTGSSTLTRSSRRRLIRTVLETERVLIDEDKPKPESLKGDDIEMDADGYPILPACLDRRPKETT
jgi:hypothetical protein